MSAALNHCKTIKKLSDMKKIFTLALGLIAAASVSAQTITVKCHGEQIAEGSTYTAYMETGIDKVDLTEFDMGFVDAPYWLIDPECEITCSEDATLVLTANLVETKEDYIPQLCWGNTDKNKPEDNSCWPMTYPGPDVRYGIAKAGVPFNPQIDFVKIQGGMFNPGYEEPGENDINSRIEVSVANMSGDKLFAFNLILTSQKKAGVGNIAADDNNAPREYFDLQGRAVANPANGLYIVRQGSKVTKEYIR